MACNKRSRPTRRRFLERSAGACLGAAIAGCERRAPEKRPNILFAFADDQSWPHAGACGDPVVRTPAFDRVAREGVLFTHSFAACPSCTPSRGAVLTGRQIWQVEQGGVLYGTLPDRYPLYPHLLEDADYHTGYTGKGWGPGDWQAGGLKRYPIGTEFNSRMVKQPVPEGIDPRDYAANFDEFLTARPRGAPFCFWFGCREPHRPYQDGAGLASGRSLEAVEVPSYWPDSKVIRSDILDYYFEVEWFDAHLARMISRLEEIGELDNTLIVVTSDNGMPFPRAKVNLYDPGVRMPLAVRWGARVPSGRVIDDFVAHIDFAPTFLDAGGLTPPPEMTGRSLLPILTSGASGIVDGARDSVCTGLERHTWCRPDGATYPIRALRTRDYLYLRNFAPERWPTGGPDFISSNKTPHGDVDGCPTKTFMLAEANRRKYPRQYELCFGKRPAEELYDVREDPAQMHNLARDPTRQDVKRKLWERLESYLRRTGDPRIEGRDPWQAYVYHQTTGFGATFNRSLSEEERRRARGLGPHKPE